MSNQSFVKLHEQQIPEATTIDTPQDQCPSCHSEVFPVSRIYDRDSERWEEQFFCCGYDWIEV